MNKVIQVGRLCKDPELSQTPNGNSKCTFSIAVNRRFERGKADFFNIIVWREQGENCAKYLKKGSEVRICGELHIRDYVATDGLKRIAVEIVADEVEFGSRSNEAETVKPHTSEQEIPENNDLPF